MKEKIKLFIESLSLVWKSSPVWTLLNILNSILQSILPLVLLWLLKTVVDVISKTASDPSAQYLNVLWPVAELAAVWFLNEVSLDFGSYIRKQQSQKLEVYMYELLHAKSVKLDLINFEHPEYFDCLSRATREAPWRPNSILNNMVFLFRGGLSLLLMAGLILSLRWTLVLLLIVANIPGIWLRLHYSNVLYNFQRQQTPEARKSSYFNWLLTGDRPSRELRLFGLGSYFRKLFRESFNKQKAEELNIIRRRTLIELISNLFKASALLITFLFIARQTINGIISLGQMAMIILAFRQGMIYIKDLFIALAGLYEDSLFIADTFEFLNIKEMVTAAQPVIEPSALKKSLTVEGLSFTYPGNQFKTIDNISFEIQKGQIIALVGANGAGKSTLARLLCRLYDPDSGKIKYDGQEITHMDPEAYRKQFSVVFQDFMLYNLTAGENIRMGNIDEEHPGTKIRESAEASGIHELITKLPNGYDTAIGNLFNDSRELSWGEWQKIALARALYSSASIMILDEPSSALDAETEHEIFSRFRELVKGRTSILISHRFTSINLADKIIVLDKGSISEIGTHDELMKRQGLYYTMYTKQSSRFINE
jgi:ATP-binding cassette, subfamily B, bacterial